MEFRLVSSYKPQGDQGTAIEALTRGIFDGEKHQVLLGVTGSGKTYSMAKVVEQVNRPALILAHNKTLAAQLYHEFKSFFPHNAVEYFVSYYDYYQPEAYIPAADVYIEKEATINDELDKLRLSATKSLFERRDCIIVASVSCIYGLGSPEAYYGMLLFLEKGQKIKRDDIVRKLVEILYERTEGDFRRGTFRVRGDVIEIFPTYDDNAYRVELWGDEVESLAQIDPLFGTVKQKYTRLPVYPKTHYVMQPERKNTAVQSILEELAWWEAELEKQGRMVEAQRVHQRTRFDLEMIKEMGYCHGIENYSRHFTGRLPGEPPPTLLDYVPRDYLLFIDESHQTIPQLHGMWHGDRSRKQNLIEYGFRLPSALDNRPLTFEEFEHRVNQAIYVSATPGPYELTKSAGVVVEQIIRPTGLVDPEVEVRPVKGQIDDLLHEIRQRAEKHERVLVTTLTKRMAEDLAEYYSEVGVRCRYMHSEIETLERIKILRDLRKGEFDVLIGINLLREGLDLPEVSLVAILDADKEGFLRSARVVDSDHRPLRASPQWPRHPLRRQHDRFHAEGDGRDKSAAGHPACLQPGAWNHTRDHCAPAGHDAGRHRRSRLCRPDQRSRRHARVPFAGGAGCLHRETGERYARGGQALRVRAGRQAARHHPRAAHQRVHVHVKPALVGDDHQRLLQCARTGAARVLRRGGNVGIKSIIYSLNNRRGRLVGHVNLA